MEITKPDRTGWDDFPDVAIIADESTVKKHPDYTAAKAGNIAAAKQLVADVLDSGSVDRIKKAIGGDTPLLTPVYAFEATGINRIPAVFAEVLGECLGLSVNEEIVQINRVGHTGASGYHRLAFPALFDGIVEGGKTYLLVDDFVGQGGTLANLKGYIESRGGRVVLAATLTGKPYSAKLALTNDTLLRLRERHGELENWWQEAFSYGFDRLTESEARYLERSDDIATIRNRLAAARS